jgi:hypothetical protein
VTFEGVLLSDLLAKVTMPAGENLRGKALAQYLVVEATDGYRAVFALPELDPAFTERRVYLVTKRDGKPLSEKEGPFRIVVPDEKRPARWVRQVTAMRVKPWLSQPTESSSYFWIITSVDLITTVTASPGFRFNSSALRRA